MIVEVQDLQDYMSGVSFSIEQTAAAEEIIAGVQSEVEAFLNRPIEPETFTEMATVDSHGWIIPKKTPVISVSSVIMNNAPVTGWRLGDYGVYIGAPGGYVTLTYTAGLTGADAAMIRLTVLRVASREMQNRHDDTLSVKDLGTHDVAPLPEGLQDEDRARIQRFRRRVVC